MIIMKISKLMAAMALVMGCSLATIPDADAAQYSASFKNTDITEFINTVGKNLHKNMIIDPSIKGKINIKSYDVLNDGQYYQFFLSVLDLYGLAAIPVGDQTIKVVKSAKAKAVGVPLYDEDNPGEGSEMVVRVVPVGNVSVKELSPLLRQLVDLTEGGNVVHYEPSNVLIITGRANVVNRIVDVVKRVDKSGNQDVDIIKVRYASASELARLANSILNDEKSRGTMPALMRPKIEADDRSNSIVISGEPNIRARAIQLIRRLDQDQEFIGNTKVIYLKYAKAKNVVETLQGLGADLDKNADKSAKNANTVDNIKFGLYADEQTNAVIINAQPDLMQQIESVIAKLDIRRAQVYVEAIIVEISNQDAAQFGVQWANVKGGGVNFTGQSAQGSVFSLVGENGKLNNKALAGMSGGIAGFYSGNWLALVTALRSDTRSNVLSTPSIVTLDNQEAMFTVGQEVPVVTGSQNSVDSSNIYKTVERKSVGTKLKFTPQINEGDSVILDIEQEVSSVDTSAGDTGNGPTFSMRNIKNTMLVKSGETVVLGGLLSEQSEEVVSKVPLLGDIPLIGNLFKSTSTSKSKRNLMVFIHPIILRDPETYASISRNKYTKFRAEQIDRHARGIPLLPDEINVPVLPEYGADAFGSVQTIAVPVTASDDGSFVISPDDILR